MYRSLLVAIITTLVSISNTYTSEVTQIDLGKQIESLKADSSSLAKDAASKIVLQHEQMISSVLKLSKDGIEGKLSGTRTESMITLLVRLKAIKAIPFFMEHISFETDSEDDEGGTTFIHDRKPCMKALISLDEMSIKPLVDYFVANDIDDKDASLFALTLLAINEPEIMQGCYASVKRRVSGMPVRIRRLLKLQTIIKKVKKAPLSTRANPKRKPINIKIGKDVKTVHANK